MEITTTDYSKDQIEPTQSLTVRIPEATLDELFEEQLDDLLRMEEIKPRKIKQSVPPSNSPSQKKIKEAVSTPEIKQLPPVTEVVIDQQHQLEEYQRQLNTQEQQIKAQQEQLNRLNELLIQSHRQEPQQLLPTMGQVSYKRRKAGAVILAAAFGTGVVVLNPLSNTELAKQIFITLADVAMYIMLWDIYFDEKLAQKNLQSILSELFAITLSSIFTAYVLAKGITVSINYLTNALGSIGWPVSSVLATFATGLLGLGWASYCDDWYRNSQSKK